MFEQHYVQLMSPENLEDPLGFVIDRNTEIVQCPAFFCKISELHHIFQKTFSSLPIPGKISRFPEESWVSSEKGLVRVVTPRIGDQYLDVKIRGGIPLFEKAIHGGTTLLIKGLRSSRVD